MKTNTTAFTSTTPAPVGTCSCGPWMSISGRHCWSAGSGLRLGERTNLQLQEVLDYTRVTKDAVDCKNNAPQTACWCRPWYCSLAKAWSKPNPCFWGNNWVAVKSRASGGVGLEGGWQRRAQAPLRALPCHWPLLVTAVGPGARLSKRHWALQVSAGGCWRRESCKVSSLRTCLCPRCGLGKASDTAQSLGCVVAGVQGWPRCWGSWAAIGAARECWGDRRISPRAAHVDHGRVFWDKPTPRVFVRV